MKFAIIASPLTNFVNVARLISRCNYSAEVYEKPNKVKNSEILVLPGNGSFREYHRFLIENSWDKLILERLQFNRPIVAICAGMQVLAITSEEAPEIEGFKHFTGKFKKFYKKETTNIGRKKIEFVNYKEFHRVEGFFCHSYYYIPDKKETETVLAYSEFSGVKFPAIVRKKNVLGFQFHPELSGPFGSKFVQIFKEQNNVC